MPSRKISDLTPETQEKYRAFEAAMKAAGIPFVCTCTYRSQEEQNELFAQGRTKPGSKVTWTTLSRHTDRTAFDIALLKEGGKAHWDIKVSVNANEIPDYDEAGQIGESVGLHWGGRFSSPDRPHFQLER